jgi:hypothetical protein
MALTGCMAIFEQTPRAPRRLGSHRSRASQGVEGNELLTGLAGAVLIVVLAALGLSILRIGPLISVHLFVGMMLIGPLAVKLAGTGYRFACYYGGRREYVRKGPPLTPLRLLAVPVVGLTLIVMGSGIALLLGGPASRPTWFFIHKASFILWLGATAIHVLAHLRDCARAVVVDLGPQGYRLRRVRGRNARLLAIATGLGTGVILALIALPSFGAWSHYFSVR